MIRKNQRLINGLNLLSDLALIFVSYFAALFTKYFLIENHSGDLIWFSEPLYWSIALVYSALLVLVYYFAGLYGSYRFKREESEIFTVLTINGVGVLTLMALMYLVRMSEFSRVALFLFWGYSSLFVLGKRTVTRALLRHYRKLGYNQKHVVVVGSGHFAHQYVEDVKRNPHMGFTVDGYVSKEDCPNLGTRLGSFDELEEILSDRQVDEVVAALEPSEIGFMKQVLETADKTGVRISIIPFYNDYIPNYPSVGKTPAYIRVCDMLEQTIKDDSFHSPVLETRPHLLYYRGNIERISGVLIKHVFANHLVNPLRYWLVYRLRGNLRYVWPRRIRMWLRAGKRWLLQLQGGEQARNQYLAIKNELQADRQESRSLNELRREEKKAIRRQTDELVGMLKNALFSEDCVQKRRYDKEKARQHLIRSSQLKREKARIRQYLNAHAETNKLE